MKLQVFFTKEPYKRDYCKRDLQFLREAADVFSGDGEIKQSHVKFPKDSSKVISYRTFSRDLTVQNFYIILRRYSAVTAIT